MLKTDADRIILTKGDSAVLQVNCVTAADEEYEPEEGDVFILTVKRLPSADSPVLLSVRSAPGSARIVLAPEDTRDIPAGLYSADIELRTEDGAVYTVFPTLDAVPRGRTANYRNFDLRSEVTAR